MRRAAIVSPIRTGVGRYLGALSAFGAEDLGALVIRDLMTRTGLDPERVDEVVFAQGYPSGEAPCIGRWAALAADLPLSVSGTQVDRRCGSGVQAIANAAMMVQTGVADVVIAGGAESMSNVEFYTTAMRQGQKGGSVTLHDRLERGRVRSQPEARFGAISGMIETAENLATEYQISRTEADAYALRSQQRAAAAWEAEKFKDHLVGITVPQGKGAFLNFATDEGVRPNTTLESLSQLKPINGGVVTAGNASQQNDAAAACLVVAEDQLEALGLTPSAYLVGWAAAGCHPATMGIGPVPAVEKLFKRTGLGFDDMDLVELNEAFACQVLAVLKGWHWHDDDRLNVNGSGISLGHPIGATGGRILADMLSELHRRQGRYALETMCIGGGQGIAAIFERAA
ncbi:MAG TPA: acetyl-CoA C-acyltransferase [Gammaproteobacteria bacterium]|jgi:acetyl-CoA C-acetyltransferase|nr:acetyl-CoA C-acetyltransferase [Gammaproteobacteria bacterium]MDC1102145.1 acetyl-CoA C-acetyltransferase [Pseudomonadales bacterium]HAJ31272.1 acetyl-CoA C-acyltransferase [Gammaproteobacteria bacterium]